MSVFLINPFLFLFGICIGSFINVVVYWLEEKRKNLFGRSFCDFCKKTLQWHDLIPIFSFLYLKGRCRYCQVKIKFDYFLVELFTGILFVIFGMDIILILLPFLIIIFVYDLKHYLIPDIIIFPAIGIAFVFKAFSLNWSLIGNSLFAGLVSGGFFAILVLISKERWMGRGDIYIGALMGIMLGWPNIISSLLLAFLLGAIIGLALIFFSRKTIKSQVPFGPFLISALIICLYLEHLHLLSSWQSQLLLG